MQLPQSLSRSQLKWDIIADTILNKILFIAYYQVEICLFMINTINAILIKNAS